MKKQGKTIIIGLSSIFAVATTTKVALLPDEKLTTDSLNGSTNTKPVLKTTEKTSKTLLAKTSETSGKEVKLKRKLLSPERKELINKIIQNGLSRMGTPYIFGGTTEKGFDCSGFVQYAFKKFNINVPRSSTELAGAGKKVKREDTRKGDILIFTGTNVSDRTPGHVGIVTRKVGKIIEFMHSSSNGGVKISQVEGTNYERRFLETRRVL